LAAVISAEQVRANLATVRDRIAGAGGDPARVTIVAVTKRFDASVVRAAMTAGLEDVGESYAQELLAVAAELDVQPRWHFVGQLQRNKVAKLAPYVHWWHSVDRPELGAAIARAAAGATVLVQVNATGEPQKAGCDPGTTADLVAALRDQGLDVRGLMTIGPTAAAHDPAVARPAFALVRRLADDLDLPERSMGMSDDLEVAVSEGATVVRVGTALFGPRGPSRSVEH
jgi:pyridoxal phosphate enzyme (YggS family)